MDSYGTENGLLDKLDLYETSNEQYLFNKGEKDKMFQYFF